MGYYNFYRLIKEIRYLFSNKKIKKLLTIIAIFIIVILILHNKGYCANYDEELSYSNRIYPVNSVDMPRLHFNAQVGKFNINNSGENFRYIYTYALKPGFYYDITTSLSYSVIFTSELPGVDVVGYGVAAYNGGTHTIFSGGNLYLNLYTSTVSIDSQFTVTEYCYVNTDYQNIHYATNYDLLVTGDRIIDAINNLTYSINSYLYGDESKTDYPMSTNFVNGIYLDSNGKFSNNNMSLVYYVKVKNGYNYKVHYKYNYDNISSKSFRIGFSQSVPVLGLTGVTLLDYHNETAYEGDYEYTATSDGYLCISGYQLRNRLFNVDIVSNYNETQELGLSQAIINNNNQNTQTIDNTITNSNVDVQENQLVTDNTQDITEGGFDNIFEMIRTAFTGTPSSITFPIPFVNQSFTLQPDFLSHYLQVGGLSFFVTLINAYWYFVVARFIVKKIHYIIEALKEGEFEQTTGNIKTEVF